MLTGSLYQLYWLFACARELAAVDPKGIVTAPRRILWPFAMLVAQGGVLYVASQGIGADFGDIMTIATCVIAGVWVIGEVEDAIGRVESKAGIVGSPHAPTLAIGCLLVGLLIGGTQALPGGEAGTTDIVGLLASGVVLPFWMLYLQYRVNRALERMDPTSDDATSWGGVSNEDVDPVTAEIRRRLAEHDRNQGAHERLDIVPWATIGLAAVCTVVFAWQLASFGLHFSLGDLRRSGAMSVDLVNQGDWWRLLTAHITHGSVGHWAGNMFVLSLTGWMVERAVGHRGMLAIFGSGMFVATVLMYFVSPMLYGPQGSAVLGLGESGIGFAVMGALLGLDPRATTPVGRFGRFLCVYGAIGSLMPGVGLLAHLGGFLGGFACAWFLRQRMGLDLAPPAVRPIAVALAAAPVAAPVPAPVPAPVVAPAALPLVVPPPMIAPPVVQPPIVAPPPSHPPAHQAAPVHQAAPAYQSPPAHQEPPHAA